MRLTHPLPSSLPSISLEPISNKICLLLDNIRSIYNVGAMFRTADGAGLERVYCCGMTATPRHPKVAKTALGAQENIPWDYGANACDIAYWLQKAGWQIWVLEEATHATNLFTLQRTDVPIVLVVGNERAGVDPALLEMANQTVSLPMHGSKGSLNAAVAAGIALYTLVFAK